MVLEGCIIRCSGCKRNVLVSEDDPNEIKEEIDNGVTYYIFDFICSYSDCGFNNKELIINKADIREIKLCEVCNKRFIPKNKGKTLLNSKYDSNSCKQKAYRDRIRNNKQKLIKPINLTSVMGLMI